jgi:acyl carrier protein
MVEWLDRALSIKLKGKELNSNGERLCFAGRFRLEVSPPHGAARYNPSQGDWMQRQELTPKLKELIVRRLKLDVDPATIDDGAPLFGDGLGLDSIDALELVLGLEQEFGIKVEDEEVGVKAFASVNALADFVEQKKSA